MLVTSKTKYMFRSMYQIGIVAAFLILVPTLVRAEEAKKDPVVSLLCTPMVVVEKGANSDAFPLTAGQGTTFTCSASSLNKEEKRVLLMGKETYEKDLPAATVTEVTLSAEPVFSTLTFPAAYRTGAYGYTFSVIDLETKEEVATPNLFQGVLKGEAKAVIKELGVDKEQYQWKDQVSMHLALGIPEGVKIENEKLSLFTVMQNQEGQECIVLEDNQVVIETEADYALNLPGEESGCTNALSVMLKQDGKVIDQKVLAFGLRDTNNTAEQFQENIFSKIPKMLLIGIGLTSVLCLALGGYFLLRRKSVRRF